jgi:hypothetical protein
MKQQPSSRMNTHSSTVNRRSSSVFPYFRAYTKDETRNINTKQRHKTRHTRLDKTNKTRLDETRLDKTRQEKTSQDKTKQDKARQDKTRQGKTRQDKTRQGKTRQDKTRKDKARQDKPRQDKTRQGKPRQDKTRQIGQDKPRQARAKDLFLKRSERFAIQHFTLSTKLLRWNYFHWRLSVWSQEYRIKVR